MVLYDAVVLLRTPGVSQTEHAVRLVGYRPDGNTYWVATVRQELTSEQVALVYTLLWDIDNFFAWWKRHLRVYHLIARSEHGLMVQLLSGLITYLLLAIYCQDEHGETVTIRSVRELRNRIHNESRQVKPTDLKNLADQNALPSYASP